MPSRTQSSILKEDLESGIRRTLENDRIVIKDVVTTIPSLIADNFMSEIEHLDVEIDGGGGGARQLKLFLKKEIKPENQPEGMPNTAFDREILFFDVILRDILGYCRANGNNKVDTGFFPLPFYTGMSGNERVIVMENVIHDGYKMHADKMVSQDLRHAKLVVKTLATFHATTYVIQKKSGVDLLGKLSTTTSSAAKQPAAHNNNPITYMISSAIRSAVNVLKVAPNCSQLSDKLEKFLPHAPGRFMQFYQPSKGNINVLCHGDCWNNNMMFVYDEDGRPIKMKLVDWQGVHGGIIGKDLCHYFYMSVRPDIVKKSLPMILHTYYDQFRNVVEALGADDVMFSYEEFTKEYEASKLFGLMTGIMATVVAPFIANAEKAKAENDGNTKFDVSYMMEHTKQMDLATLLPEEKIRDLVDIVRGCEQQLDLFLSKL